MKQRTSKTGGRITLPEKFGTGFPAGSWDRVKMWAEAEGMAPHDYVRRAFEASRKARERRGAA